MLEGIEQLRCLDLDITIQTLEIDGEMLSIDTYQHLEKSVIFLERILLWASFSFATLFLNKRVLKRKVSNLIVYDRLKGYRN